MWHQQRAPTCRLQRQWDAWLHELEVACPQVLSEGELQLASLVCTSGSASLDVLAHDPMMWEEELGQSNDQPPPHLGQDTLLDPIMESVGFEVGQQLAQFQPASNGPTDLNVMAALAPTSPPDFVNTSIGAEPVQMLEGVILSSPSSFVHVLSKPVASKKFDHPPPPSRRKHRS
jgi:hypothetical protein